jgi:uncharacterized protein DUF6285
VTDRPDAAGLVEAVREFLEAELLPALGDPRLRFRALVAMNALAIARRELEASNRLLLESEEERRALAERIRAGDVPEGTHGLLKEHVAAKLRISNPAWLERYD